MSTVAATFVDTPDRRTLAYEPALDGIRGVAVAGVIAFHLGHLQGGFLGVDLFFTLSGYLITRLLLLEHESTGRISRAAFWTRRAWRLLPALYLLLAAMAVYAALFARPDELEGIRGPGIASLLYVTNWWFIVTGDGYWDLFAAPSPLEHMWSLAIEEQFYVVWPLVVVAVLGIGRAVTAPRRDPSGVDPLGRLLAVTLGLAVVSTVLLGVFAGDDINRAYFGSIARSSSILIGAALAIVVHRRGRWFTAATESRAAPVAGAVAVGYLAWSWIAIDGAADLAFYRGGFLLHAVAVAVLIALFTARPSGPGATVLGIAPLRGLGVVSYGLYLWHWPVIVVLDAERTGLSGGSLLVTRLVVSLALTLVSYVAVERPARHRLSKHLSAVKVFVPAAAVVAVALVVSTVPAAGGTVIGPAPASPDAASATTVAAGSDDGAENDPGTSDAGTAANPDAPAATDAPPADDDVTTDAAVVDVVEDEDGAAPPVGIVRTTPMGLPELRTPTVDDPLRVLLVGDSYMFDAEPGIAAALAASDVVEPVTAARVGFTITADGWEQTLTDLVTEHRPELVVAMWARFDAAWLGDSGDRGEYEGLLDESIDLLASDGAAVAFVGLAPSLTAGVDREPVDRTINEIFEQMPGRHAGSAFYVDPDPIVAPHGEPVRWLETPEGELLVRKVDVSHFCGDGSARFGLAIGEIVEQLSGVVPADPATWWAGEWRDDPRYDDPAGACA